MGVMKVNMGFEHNIDVVCRKVILKYSCEELHGSIKDSLISRKTKLNELVTQIQDGLVSPKNFELLIEEQKSLLILDLKTNKHNQQQINDIANMAIYELAKHALN